MSDTRAQQEVEQWVRDEWLSTRLGTKLTRKKVRLSTGGDHEFDAVSDDCLAISTVETGRPKTASGKPAMAKIHKIRTGIYFLLLTDAKRRLVALTDRSMYDWWINEQSNMLRVPDSIEFLYVELPDDLQITLVESQKVASLEMTP